ncbi:MAG: DUF58 domain-containing protein [Candidatus Magnetoovum sp. WYHC-5]|nr:DUF58 domain-containing protein [Candidatus Magnetoovum sp. WYHC-5]
MLYILYLNDAKAVLWRRLHFTNSGYFVIIAMAISVVLSIDPKMSMAYQILGFLAVILMVAFLYSLSFKVNFHIKRLLPKYATVEHPVYYKILIENISKKKEVGLEILDIFKDLRPTFDEFIGSNLNSRFQPFLYHNWHWLIKRKAHNVDLIPRQLPTILPGETIEVQMQLTPTVRGRLGFATILIARKDPFGLFRATRKIKLEDSIIVLPKRYEIEEFKLRGSRRYHRGGVALAAFTGDSEEFHSLKDYTPGEQLRFIDWKSLAKTDKLVVKKYQEEYFARHALVLDTFGDERLMPAFELGVSIAASFIATIDDSECLLDLMFVENDVYCFTMGRGLGDKINSIEVLASIALCKDKGFSVLVSSVESRVHLLTSIIFVFLAWDKRRKALVDLVRATGLDVRVIVVCDKKLNNVDEALPFDGLVHMIHTDRALEDLKRLSIR